jgi:predicted nucleotidyltransferase
VRTDGPGQSARLMQDVAAILSGADTDYAVIGAMAASVHGVVRASLDADAVVPVGAEKLRELERTFREGGFTTELRYGDPTDPIPALLTLADSFGNRVDLLGGLRGFDPEAFSRTLDVSFEGAALRIVGLEDFIAMKLFAGGPLDLDDARRVLRAAGSSVDVTLLRRVTRAYGVEASAHLDALL